TRQAIEDAIATVGGVADRAGALGVDRARVVKFFDEAAAFVAWSARAGSEAALVPLGERTAAAAQAVAKVRAKVDDWFTRSRLAAYEPRAAAALDAPEDAFAALAGCELDDTSPALAKLPLSRIVAGGRLDLRVGLNPSWRGAVAAVTELAVAPLLGDRA